MKINDTIETIVSSGLCTGCGTCVGICPNNGISMNIDPKKGIYNPKIIDIQCIKCNLCIKSCPGYDINLLLQSRTTEEETEYDNTIGKYVSCYVGHSSDKKIRYKASSGGLISSVLIFALESGLIDGALVTRKSDNNPIIFEPFIARTREDILLSASSKYCPIPLNNAIKKILDLDKDFKIAVVGLPCHIHGFRKAEAVNGELKKKIQFHLGIMCARNDNLTFIDYLLYRYLIRKEDVKDFSFRGNGWPGYLMIEQKNGELIEIPYEDYIPVHLLEIFSIKRCGLCLDPTNKLSDCSFCDAWGIIKEDDIGSSLVISRNRLGDDIILSAIKDQRIVLDKIPIESIENTQGLFSQGFIRRKMCMVLNNRLLGKNKKLYDNLFIFDYHPGLINYLQCYILNVQSFFLSKKIFWRLIKIITPIEYKHIK